MTYYAISSFTWVFTHLLRSGICFDLWYVYAYFILYLLITFTLIWSKLASFILTLTISVENSTFEIYVLLLKVSVYVALLAYFDRLNEASIRVNSLSLLLLSIYLSIYLSISFSLLLLCTKYYTWFNRFIVNCTKINHSEVVHELLFVRFDQIVNVHVRIYSAYNNSTFLCSILIIDEILLLSYKPTLS